MLRIHRCVRMSRSFVAPPPPSSPTPCGLTDSHMARLRGDKIYAASAHVTKTQDFISQIPSFFVPMEVLLKEMPGYSEQHLRKLSRDFKTGMPIIDFMGKSFVRMFGPGTFEVSDFTISNARFKKYFPDPKLLVPFLPLLKPQWTPLDILLDKAGKEAREALPFQGQHSLIYFSQLQHIVQFTADKGGAVCKPACPVPLEFSTTPCAMATSEISRHLKDHPQSIAQLEETLEEPVKAEVRLFFSSWQHFAAYHTPIFILQGEVLTRRIEHDAARIKNSTLEDQLREAEKIPFNMNRKKIRTLRRKIAIEKNPDNPLLERTNLARDIYNRLPMTGHVPLARFIETIPPSIVDLLPWKHTRFFQGHPELFKFFEFKRSTEWHITRAENPYPDGALRQDLTEDDVAIEASQCLRPIAGKALSVCSLMKKMCGPSRAIAAKRGGMGTFLSGYPENFSITQRRPDENIDSGSTVITLLKPIERLRRLSDDDDE